VARLTKDRSALLDKLVSDTITFGLHVKEGLGYIRQEYGFVSERTYFRRRTILLSDNARDSWYSYFTRIGFVNLHKKQMDILQMIQDDSLRRLHDEKLKPSKERDENLILKLKKEIRENCLMLSEFSLGTPIVAGIRSKLDKAEPNLKI
jgi:hypothetical protein